MNPTANKAKGTTFERAVADHLRESLLFPNVERAPRWGSVDKGDLVQTGPFCFELKATKSIDLASFMAEAIVECGNASKDFPVVIIKRRQKSIGQSYVVMELDDWIEMARLFSAFQDMAA